MRKLFYNCYDVNGNYVQTVSTLKLAKAWEEEEDGNEYAAIMEEVERELTTKEKKKREERLNKIDRITNAIVE